MRLLTRMLTSHDITLMALIEFNPLVILALMDGFKGIQTQVPNLSEITTTDVTMWVFEKDALAAGVPQWADIDLDDLPPGEFRFISDDHDLTDAQRSSLRHSIDNEEIVYNAELVRFQADWGGDSDHIETTFFDRETFQSMVPERDAITREWIQAAAMQFALGTRPPIEIQPFYEGLEHPDHRRDFTNWMAHFAQRSTFINRYFTARESSAKSHDQAVKAANSDHTHVRRILGFTHVQDDLHI
jgi:hypothetical protein